MSIRRLFWLGAAIRDRRGEECGRPRRWNDRAKQRGEDTSMRSVVTMSAASVQIRHG